MGLNVMLVISFFAQAVLKTNAPSFFDRGQNGRQWLNTCVAPSSQAVAGSMGSIRVRSSLSAFELLTRRETGHALRWAPDAGNRVSVLTTFTSGNPSEPPMLTSERSSLSERAGCSQGARRFPRAVENFLLDPNRHCLRAMDEVFPAPGIQASGRGFRT
jgi:hypothetical protein